MPDSIREGPAFLFRELTYCDTGISARNSRRRQYYSAVCIT
jgi:hypothetical protein